MSNKNGTKKTVRNDSPILADCLNYTNQILQGVEQWRQTLETWQYQKKVTPEEFEDALINLCRSGAIDCSDWILENIYKAVTGEEANIKKLRAIINVFCFNDEWD